MNRRQFLILSGAAGLGSVLSGCLTSISQTPALPLETPTTGGGATLPAVDTPQPGVSPLPTEISTPGATLESGKFTLPFLIDFSTLPDGAAPAWLKGATWSIASGYLFNAPTLEDELLPDPGLEASYVDGLRCISLAADGNPALAQSEDVHSGSLSQMFQGSAKGSAIYWPPLPGEIGTWYQFSIWAKRIKGGTDNTRVSLAQTGGLPVSPAESAIDAAIYQQGKVSLLSTTTNALTPYAAIQDSSIGLATVVIVDDGSLKKIVKSSLYSFLPAGQADVVIKVKPDVMLDNTQVGIVLRGNTNFDPTRYILALFSVQPGEPSTGSVSVIQVSGSTYTLLAANVSLGNWVTDAWFEARALGSTLSIWYNHAKIGDDLAIDDGELITNKFHGLFSAGDNRLKGLFLADRLIPQMQVYAGSSFTAGVGYRQVVNADCLDQFPQFDFSFQVLAIGGHNTWSNLVRLTTGGDVFILDHANDWTASWVEAMILRLWAANPATRIILISSPTWNTLDTSQDELVNAPSNKKVLLDIQALADHYGIALVDYWAWCKSVVNGTTYRLSQLTSDTIHPSVIGYSAMARLVEQYMPDGGTSMPSVLPEHLFPDCSFYLLPPTRILGKDYTSRTGSGWTDEGMAISSTTPGDTVTYTTKNPWSSFGGWRSDNQINVVEISLNGSEFKLMPFYQNGYDMESTTYGTLTVRIPDSGGNVRIDEVWLI